MELIQNESMEQFWRCGKDMVEIAEDFGKPEIPKNRIPTNGYSPL